MAFSAAGVGGLIGGIGGLTLDIISSVRAERQQRRFRRRQRRAIQEAREFADASARRVTESALFQQGQQFLEQTFGDAVGSPLVQDFAKQLRASQAARGTFFGGSPAAAEAGGLAIAAQRLRGSLLPQVQEFATAGERIRQSVLGQEATLRTAAATGTPLFGQRPEFIDPFAAGARGLIQGAAGGALLGQQFGRDRGGQVGGSGGTDATRIGPATRFAAGSTAAGSASDLSLLERIRLLSGG